MYQAVTDFLTGYYEKPPEGTTRRKFYRIIFESHTAGGKLFDICLLVMILLSIGIVMADSLSFIHIPYMRELYIAEWAVTILFSIEYVLRIWAVNRKRGYYLSLYGIFDLLAILPTYISLLAGGAQYLLILRALRLLRVFRIFKMTRYLTESTQLVHALYRSYRKIGVFMLFILILVTVLGSLMYVIEGPENGFSSIPESIYWAIVTLTTVGYGDITPVTVMGKLLASFIMLCGYAIIAVPTGIVTSEIVRTRYEEEARGCSGCGKLTFDKDARYCASCGNRLL